MLLWKKWQRQSKLAEPEGRLKMLTPEEIARLIKACPAGVQPLVTMLVATGMRYSEVASLCWGEVDIRRGIVRLPGKRTKNGRPRTIPLNGVALDVLREATARRVEGCDLVFPNRQGRARPTIIKQFKVACDRAGLDGSLIVHDLRHVAASAAASRGVPLQVIGELLGHRTPNMTARYSHLLPTAVKAGVEQIGSFLSGTDRAEGSASLFLVGPGRDASTSTSGTGEDAAGTQPDDRAKVGS